MYSCLQKALVPDGRWDRDSFKEFPEVIYWLRQGLSFFLGLALGLYPLVGFSGFVLYGVCNLFLPFLYYARYANVNIDDFGVQELASVGFQQSFGLFLLTWVLTYSTFHH